jgi:hypothetical protein
MNVENWSLLGCYAVSVGSYRRFEKACCLIQGHTSLLVKLFDAEDEGTELLRNISNCLPVDAA